jgi:uncharacterized membrane protein YfcA
VKSAFSSKTYWLICLLILVLWTIEMFRFELWGIFNEYWPLSVTMVLGSFVAGATAEGGGAVAFPVFTKLFSIAPDNARNFSFMIQSIGMTMAGAYIFLSKIPILKRVLIYGLLGGIPGIVVGSEFLSISGSAPKLLFSFIAALFGFFLLYNRFVLKHQPHVTLDYSPQNQLILITVGFVGGLVSSIVGVGIDILIFITLTLGFRINEKISTPTTVILMGLLSVVGFFYHAAVLQDIEPEVCNYWMSCIPVVIFGAPLGAYACNLIKRDHLIYGLLSLIAIELISTVILIPIENQQWILLAVSIPICTLFFILLLLLGKRRDSIS